jgi:type IV pilus assembly protein PilW
MRLNVNANDRRPLNRTAGVTLVELMVSMALSLVVVLISTSLFLSSQVAYTANEDARAIEENGRIAIETIARTLRQARYDDWDPGNGVQLTQLTDSAGIVGLDSRSLKSTTTAIDSPVAKAVNGSDVLTIRFHGAGTGAHGDGTMLNCAGFGVASPSGPDIADRRGWSIFYVAEDSTGEPELRCKYQGKNGWSAVAIARGVETFQLLYGLDADMDGLPNRFVTAREIDELDGSLLLTGADSASRLLDKNRKTNWKKVVAIKVAMLVRGTRNVRGDEPNRTYHLFGSEYSQAFGNYDVGSRVDETKLPSKTRNRIRKMFSTTIMLRNPDTGGAA